jgi:signal transduction histidine kinase
MALIDEQPRSATVRARSLARVLMLEAADFSRLMATDTAICVSLLKAVTMMVRRSNEAHVADLDRQNRELARAYADLAAAQEELVSRERLSVIGKFSSLILHDIRNPLSALKTRIELLAMHRDNRDYFDQAIAKIQNDISRMETISAEFLDYARGEIRLKMTVSDIGALLERFREIIAMKTSGLGIDLCIDNRAKVRVALDEERIMRVLVNAGENACKAMPLGGKLAVRAWIEDEKLLLELEDSGQGMGKEVLAHCFDPFYSMSTAGGTGLGMVIIKNIVDAHHGTVTVESEVGKGTRVRIALPAIM